MNKNLTARGWLFLHFPQTKMIFHFKSASSLTGKLPSLLYETSWQTLSWQIQTLISSLQTAPSARVNRNLFYRRSLQTLTSFLWVKQTDFTALTALYAIYPPASLTGLRPTLSATVSSITTTTEIMAPGYNCRRANGERKEEKVEKKNRQGRF